MKTEANNAATTTETPKRGDLYERFGKLYRVWNVMTESDGTHTLESSRVHRNKGYNFGPTRLHGWWPNHPFIGVVQ